MHPTYVALNEATMYTGTWLYGVHLTCAETAAVSRGTSHATTKQCCQYTNSVDIEKSAGNIRLLCNGVFTTEVKTLPSP